MRREREAVVNVDWEWTFHFKKGRDSLLTRGFVGEGGNPWTNFAFVPSPLEIE